MCRTTDPFGYIEPNMVGLFPFRAVPSLKSSSHQWKQWRVHDPLSPYLLWIIVRRLVLVFNPWMFLKNNGKNILHNNWTKQRQGIRYERIIRVISLCFEKSFESFMTLWSIQGIYAKAGMFIFFSFCFFSFLNNGRTFVPWWRRGEDNLCIRTSCGRRRGVWLLQWKRCWLLLLLHSFWLF